MQYNSQMRVTMNSNNHKFSTWRKSNTVVNDRKQTFTYNK